MHELLAQWVIKYMDLEKNKRIVNEEESLKKLITE